MSARGPLASLVVVALAAGCAIAPPPLPMPIPDDARRAVDLLRTRWQGFTDLRALADLEVQQDNRRQRLTGVLLVRPPGSVRFEALSPFGQPFFLVTVHDGLITAYDATKNEALVGAATAETTARLLRLPFEPADLVAVLGGGAALPDDLRVAEVLPADGLGPSLQLIGKVNERRIWMDFDTGLVRQLQISGGLAEALVTYRRDADGALTGFDLTAGQGYLTGSVRYRRLVRGQGVDPDRFTLTLPKGAKLKSIR